MATIVSFSPNRALDLNGFAVPGALATFYDSGTSRLRAVYADPSCETPHPSPLAADGAGVFPPVYDVGDGDVKVAVTTSDGVMLAGYPMDPVRIISTDSAGASGIQFNPTEDIPETNVQDAIERLQENMIQPLLDYGLGVTGNAPLLVDLDADTIATGFYRYNGDTTGNFPSGVTKANTGAVLMWRNSSANGAMLLSPANQTAIYLRKLVAGEWGDWTRVMLGTNTATDAVWAAGASTEPTTATPAAIKAAIGGLALGGGQTWQSFPGRTHDTVYQNATGRPIMVAVTADATDANRSFQVSANGTSGWITVGTFGEATGGMWSSVSVVIPAGWRYRILGEVSVQAWAELR